MATNVRSYTIFVLVIVTLILVQTSIGQKNLLGIQVVRSTPTEAELTALSSESTLTFSLRPENEMKNPAPTAPTLGGGALSGVITVGAGGNYSSLTNSGGAFQAINTIGLSGNLTINIISDLAAETGAVALNEIAGGFSVLIRPSGTRRTITGTSGANSGLIVLNSADNITIDGSLGNTDDRGLTITNDTVTSAVVWLQSGANGANGNTIRNCNLYGSATSNIVAGVVSGANTLGTAATAPNSNNTIENVRVIKAQNGAFLSGAAAFDQNWMIRSNDFGSTVASEKLSFRGILLGNANNFTITQNRIVGISSTTTTASTMTGIQLANGCTNGTVTRNFVTDVKHNNPSGFGANGIFIGQTANAANLILINNIVSDIATIGFNGIGLNDNAYGIVISAGSGYKLYNKSAYLSRYDPTIASAITTALNITSGVTATGAIELINNTFW